jgi:2-iminobutanoate/2-iminopropanoate deaminase
VAVERQAGPEGVSFSNSVRVRHPAGSWVFVSGQFGSDQEGKVVAGGIAAESKVALEHVLHAVREAGGTAADVIKITAYVTSLDAYARYNDVRREIFTDSLPSSTAVKVAGLLLPEASIEIDAVAFVENENA